MTTQNNWTPSNISNAIPMRSNDLEFQDNAGEWRHFTIIATPERIVFGGVCNVGFIERGYMMREDYETLDESLWECFEELQTYYNDGEEYVSRIVCNERM